MYSIFSSKKQPQSTLTIGFMGDVMLGRLVNDIIESKGYLYPWGNTLSLLNTIDFKIINLECALTTSIEKVFKVFNFKALPDRVLVLQKAGIDIVNLANNHSLDFGKAGLKEMLHILDNTHIKHVGAGQNSDEAKKPIILIKNNIKIGIIGYTDNEPTWKATSSSPGTNYITVGDIKTIKHDIENIRKTVDILILTIHWGPNMRQEPSPDFVQFAHDIIDAGVDIIHGHSSHVFQPIEIYKNKIIMYDTGDFIDDYAVDPILRNDESFLFTITVSKNGPELITLTPVIINNMQVNYATDKEKEKIIQKMQKLSGKYNTYISPTGEIRITK